MREVCVDTSAWLALADRNEHHHVAVRASYETLIQGGTRLVTTDLVVAETHILLRRRLGSDAAMRFLDGTEASPRIEVEFMTLEGLAEAVEILRRYRDHDLSLADALSFAIMKRRAIQTALTLDRHFRTAGFDVLPGPAPR